MSLSFFYCPESKLCKHSDKVLLKSEIHRCTFALLFRKQQRKREQEEYGIFRYIQKRPVNNRTQSNRAGSEFQELGSNLL
jgi:hypothetical protein